MKALTPKLCSKNLLEGDGGAVGLQQLMSIQSILAKCLASPVAFKGSHGVGINLAHVHDFDIHFTL